MSAFHPIRVDVNVFNIEKIECDEDDPVNIKKVTILMEKKSDSNREIFEFNLNFDDLEEFKGYFIGGNGRRDYMRVKNCVAGMIVFDAKECHFGQSVIWTYSCLPTQTISIKFNVDNKISITILVTNLLDWDESIKSTRGT